MGVTGLLLLFIIVLMLVVLSLSVYMFKTYGAGPKPYVFSIFVLGLLLLNALLFIIMFFTVIPAIADRLFFPYGSIVCILGIIAAVIEFRNNKIVALVTATITIIGLLILLLGYAVSSM
ncbi:hypothetical protein [Sporosarcina obsidiansis]|uniref:hypothetical protein n=1 Tax=Sporosarcina obsidiansis TaxID=2660748 RepID=UPI00129AD583|nr:hypothetical protein [Sporosarcina obsidiansis]